MRLLKELRIKYKLDKEMLIKFFGYELRQSYDAFESIHKRYTVKQFLRVYELYNDTTGNGAAEFIDKLKKEIK
jgi:hypothetical protein